MSTQIAILGRLVRPGMRFEHNQWIVDMPNGAFRPVMCTVTAVRRGVVHYRSEFGLIAQSNPTYFVTVIARWLDEAA